MLPGALRARGVRRVLSAGADVLRRPLLSERRDLRRPVTRFVLRLWQRRSVRDALLQSRVQVRERFGRVLLSAGCGRLLS